jgi:broad specificity phosphatase PhoE
MTSNTVVHVLRHGEVHNPEKILYGRLPGFRLSELGGQMAKAAAQALTERDITYVVASPLERAQETAEPIAAQFKLPVASDERLIESANWFEGKKVGPGDGSFRDPRNWWVLRDPVTPSWGEPYKQIAERMFAAIHEARVAAEGHEAVCGTTLGAGSAAWRASRRSTSKTRRSSASATPSRPRTSSRCPRAPGRPKAPDATLGRARRPPPHRHAYRVHRRRKRRLRDEVVEGRRVPGG